MQHKKALVYTLILSVVITVVLILCSELFVALISSIVQKFDKFLGFSVTVLDACLVGFVPFWSVFLYPKKELEDVKKLVFRSLFFLLSFTFFSTIAFIVIYQFKFKQSEFSPEYLLYEPFVMYWTIFNLLAVFFPPLIFRIRRKKGK
ncbi:MAG: hypothetical protein ACK5B9_02065 [Flavobacteriia bacterium]